MEKNTFFETLARLLTLPFEYHEVDTIDENCGTVWITLNDGRVYYIMVGGSVSDE